MSKKGSKAPSRCIGMGLCHFYTMSKPISNMPYYVYILYSAKIDRYYIGSTADPAQRLRDHNFHERSRMWTRRGIPWEMKFQCKFETKAEAQRVERKLKKSKSRKVLEVIIESGNLPEWILQAAVN